MKKFTAFILAFLLIFCVFTSCNKAEEETAEESSTETTDEESTAVVAEQTKANKKVTLAYFSTDSLNPYKATGQTNAELSSLYCDSLFTLTSDYSVEPLIAQDYEQDGKTITVTLNSNINFSDGTELTASDVAYSFRLAKKSTFYSERLSNFSSAIPSGDTVVFTETYTDIYGVNCLDFPIIKTGTGSKARPTGSGAYVLKKSNGRYVFKYNSNYSFDEELSQSKIYLHDISDVKNKLYLVQAGTLSFVYDNLSEDTDSSSNVNANQYSVNQNNLIYIGFNSTSTVMSSELKKAISILADKADITREIYGTNAATAYNLFNPAWKVVSSLKSSDTKADIVDAQSKLEEAGFTISDTKVMNGDEQLTLSLLVCNSDSRKTKLAKSLRKAIKAAGINVEINSVDSEHYSEALQDGDYDLYVGEVRLTANMDLSCFFSADGNANYGIDRTCVSAQNYDKLRSGAMEIVTYVNMFNEDLPFLPICYKNAIAYYSRELQFDDEVCENDVYANVYSWII